MTRILIVLNAAWDLALHRMPVVEAARAAGLEVHLAYPPGTGSPKGDWPPGVCHEFPLDRRSMRPWREVQTIRALTRLYRRVRPDVVHHFTSKPVAYGSIAARSAGVQAVINSITGFGFAATGQDGSWLARKAQRVLFRMAAGHPRVLFVCQNDDDAQHMRNLARSQEQVQVIRGSGVDVDRFRPLPLPDDHRIMYVGRLSRQKGVLELVDAVMALRKEGMDVPVEVVGDVDPGNPASLDRADVEVAFATASIQWSGWVEDVVDALARAAIVVLPSHGGEGVPMSLLEAGAMGRVLVTTDVPGCRDVVTDGKTGVLVPPRDPGALATALRDTLRDPQRMQRLGADAATHVRGHFSAATVQAGFVQVYQHMASRAVE